jgi:hypothetical protein
VPIQMLNLDDLTWDDLVREGRSLIPAFSREWTNHNPSDPGITLMELFAYLSEGLIYQLNRVGDKNERAFLRLINGSGWRQKKSLDEEKRTALHELDRRRRAVTAEDFEKLTLATNEKLPPAAKQRIARVKCVPLRNLESQYPDSQVADAPGHVTVVVVPNGRFPPGRELLRRVKRALEPARLLTTRLHVVGPRFVTLNIRITLVPQRNASPVAVQKQATESLRRFFDPLVGGFDEQGWPFGRSVYVSEIYQLLAGLPGVNYATPTINPRTEAPMDELVVAPAHETRLKFNMLGQLEALALRPDELPGAWIEQDDITVRDTGQK